MKEYVTCSPRASHELLTILKELCIYPTEVLRYDFLNLTGSDKLNTNKMHYEQLHVKYKGLNREYINYRFMSFSDLELSFWFELRYLKAVFFVRCSLHRM